MLSGIALGLALLVGVSGIKRIAKPAPTGVAIQEKSEHSFPRVDEASRNSAMFSDSATVREHEDPGSLGKTFADEVDLIVRGSPLELMINNFAKPGADATLAVELLRQHRLITESSDDPAWSRDAERRLWETIMLSQEGPAFEIASITCRTAGCEVQVFTDSQKAASTWNDLTGRLAQGTPFAVVRRNYLSTGFDGRKMRVLYLVKDSDSSPVAEGSPP